MQTITSFSGLVHEAVGRSARFVGRNATACEMNFKEEPVEGGALTCPYCAAARKHGEAIAESFRQGYFVVDEIAKNIRASPSDVLNAVPAMTGTWWRSGARQEVVVGDRARYGLGPLAKKTA